MPFYSQGTKLRKANVLVSTVVISWGGRWVSKPDSEAQGSGGVHHPSSL